MYRSCVHVYYICAQCVYMYVVQCMFKDKEVNKVYFVKELPYPWIAKEIWKAYVLLLFFLKKKNRWNISETELVVMLLRSVPSNSMWFLLNLFPFRSLSTWYYELILKCVTNACRPHQSQGPAGWKLVCIVRPSYSQQCWCGCRPSDSSSYRYVQFFAANKLRRKHWFPWLPRCFREGA